MTTRPDSTEYASYYQKYVDLVPDGEIVGILGSQIQNTLSLLKNVSEEKAGQSYAPGKWTIKEVVGHMIDTERIFAYRALCVGRNDKTPLPGFEQDDYVAGANFNTRPLSGLIEEFACIRSASIHLFTPFTEAE